MKSVVVFGEGFTVLLVNGVEKGIVAMFKVEFSLFFSSVPN